MKIDTTELYDSIATLERLSMEREPDRAEVFDLADERDMRAEEANADELHKELYDMVERALDEAKERGVSVESLRVLVKETGMLHWGLQNSLKG